MALKRGRCPKCGAYNDIVASNNPLVEPICMICMNDTIDTGNIEHADFFCRTYNFPFDPNQWIKLFESNPKTVIEKYIKPLLNVEDAKYLTDTRDLWKEANVEWAKTKTHAQLLSNITVIKQDFMAQGMIKWGTDYTFNELIQLENLFSTTIAAFDINNPMQVDAIKKACKLSIMVDRAVEEANVKEIKELSTAYNQFVKTAKIDEMIESAQSDVIRTVADLVDYLEESGFEFTWYDGYARDIVDTTINDMKAYLRTLVLESTGLEQTLELIQTKYLEAQHTKADGDAVLDMPLERIVEVAKKERDTRVDEELEDVDIMDGYGNDDF